MKQVTDITKNIGVYAFFSHDDDGYAKNGGRVNKFFQTACKSASFLRSLKCRFNCVMTCI